MTIVGKQATITIVDDPCTKKPYTFGGGKIDGYINFPPRRVGRRYAPVPRVRKSTQITLKEKDWEEIDEVVLKASQDRLRKYVMALPNLPLDLTIAEEAGRRVAEAVEKQIIGEDNVQPKKLPKVSAGRAYSSGCRDYRREPWGTSADVDW